MERFLPYLPPGRDEVGYEEAMGATQEDLEWLLAADGPTFWGVLRADASLRALVDTYLRYARRVQGGSGQCVYGLGQLCSAAAGLAAHIHFICVSLQSVSQHGSCSHTHSPAGRQPLCSNARPHTSLLRRDLSSDLAAPSPAPAAAALSTIATAHQAPLSWRCRS